MSPDDLVRWFPGDSEMARRMRAMDWSTTDLGPPERWPAHLRTALCICLTSRFPMNVWWGPTLTILYNDAYIPFLGHRHPDTLGKAARDVWGFEWHQIGRQIDSVLATGAASWDEDAPMFFTRRIPIEEVFLTLSFSPVFGPEGGVDGLVCICEETTHKVIGARRIETLRELGVNALVARTTEEAARASCAVIAGNPNDLPFAALYLADGPHRARRAACVGLSEDVFPPLVEAGDADTPDDADDPWQLATVLRTERPIALALDTRELHAPPWPEPLHHGFVLPIRTHDALAGLVILGVSPRLPFDEAYRTFFELVASQLGAALANARGFEQVRTRAEMLAELDRTKNAFLANVSHELRTPLTLILGPTEDLLDGKHGVLGDTHRAELELVHRNALRLHRLVNGLLEFARVEEGRATMAREPVDLAAFTAELAGVFRSAIESAGLELTIDCAPLPCPVCVDRGMWETIVMNLLSNALKFTWEGGIDVVLRADGEHARLEIVDTGEGIAEHERSRIFERFHRIPGQRARSHEGTGIGLSLVRELVRLHGGEIEVTSTPGRGSRFTIRVPFGASEVAGPPAPWEGPSRLGRAFVEEARAWSGSTAPAPRTDVARPRILLVDDSAEMRAYMIGMLGAEYAVTAVGDGAQALAAALDQPPALVITDVMMPALDGFALLRRLREEPRTSHVPVIMLSARAGESARIDGIEAGADDYLVKPFSARELLARVRANLALAAARLAAGEAHATSRAKDAFIAMLGHELRNPLSPIVTTLQVMRLEGKDSPELDLIDRQVAHLIRLVDDLLDVSRITSGKIDLRRKHVDLAGIVMHAVDIASPLLEQREHRLELRAQRGILVNADCVRLAQVFSNLLTNAARYSEPRSRIIVDAERAGERAIVRVIDEGIGIAPSMLDRIFDLFVQEEQAPDRSKGGLGLGLAIARGLVKLHGGTITAASAGPGRGSTFTVTLDVAQADPRATAAERTPPAQVRPSRRDRKILVVDDNTLAAQALQRALELLGYTVDIAHDGPHALQVARSFAPDIALLDIGLPAMDGYEVGRRLRELMPVRLVAVTGYGQEADVDRSRQAGFEHHLVKPVDLALLERAIETI